MLGNIAVVSSGTDNSGVNGAIRAVVRTVIKGTKSNVFGVKWGFRGLLENHMSQLTSRDVSGKIGRAGCFLGTAKPQGTIAPENINIAIENCRRRDIQGLVVIGGLHSLQVSRLFIQNGINVIGIPSTIQDDIPGTDISLGVDSAVNNIIKCLDKIRASSSSSNRVFLVQVEGRDCGTLAYRAALTSGADFVLTPENSIQNIEQLVKVKEQMYQFNLEGKSQCMIIISTGWKPGIDALQEYLHKYEHETDLQVRKTVLGYVQRGGAPTGYDRLLGTQMGNAAVKELAAGSSGKMIAVQNNQIVAIPFEDCLDLKKEINPDLINLFKLTR